MNIEPLELRIAPAAVFTYTDVDGDNVTITTSKGTNAQLAAIVTPFLVSEPGSLGPELQQIDFSADAATFAGSNLTVTAKRSAMGGDGLVNVGFIDATGADDGTALDLGRITIRGDLGQIDAGDAATGTAGIKGLTVQSIGQWGTSTQTPGADLESDIAGALGFLKIAGNLHGGLFLTAGADGKIGRVTIGGSIVGGADDGSGQIFANGALGAVKIGGNIEGGSAAFNSARIFAGGALASVTVGGALLGGAGFNVGVIQSIGEMGAVKIGGDVRGGGEGCGRVSSESTLGPVTIGGSLLGGVENNSGRIFSAGDMGAVKIGRDVVGGTAEETGSIISEGRLAGLRIGGSLIGGPFSTSGLVESTGAIGAVRIGGNLDGGDTTGATLDKTGAIFGQRIASVFIGGSMFAGTESGGGQLGRSGAIVARDDLGALTIKGSLVGNATQRATIYAEGQARPTATADVAIKSVTIGGRVEHALIFGGVESTGAPTNGNAQIGAVSVGGDWIASSLVSGATSTNGNFGDPNDAVVPGFDNDRIVAKIASITIKGQVTGLPGTLQTFAFVSQQIGSFKVAGTAIPLTSGASNDTFAAGKAQRVGPAFSGIPGDGAAVHVFEV
jgi:hypothetical protein